MAVSRSGFRFDPDALTVRLAAECTRLGIATRAQALSAWAGLTAGQRTMFLGKLIIGATSFPGESEVDSPYAIAAAQSVPGPGE